jgi:hypothetical protein
MQNHRSTSDNSPHGLESTRICDATTNATRCSFGRPSSKTQPDHFAGLPYAWPMQRLTAHARPHPRRLDRGRLAFPGQAYFRRLWPEPWNPSIPEQGGPSISSDIDKFLTQSIVTAGELETQIAPTCPRNILELVNSRMMVRSKHPT